MINLDPLYKRIDILVESDLSWPPAGVMLYFALKLAILGENLNRQKLFNSN